MFDWFVQTLRSYPEIAIFLSLAFGYYFGSFTYKGLGLGAVTATLPIASYAAALDGRTLWILDVFGRLIRRDVTR